MAAPGSRPAKVRAWRPRLEALADDLARRAAATAPREGSVDLVTASTAPFPIAVVAALHERPALWCELVERPDLAPAVVEEALRRSTPVQADVALRALAAAMPGMAMAPGARRPAPGGALVGCCAAVSDCR